VNGAPYPLELEVSLSRRIWGGSRLPELLGVPPAAGEPFGEAWQVYGGNRILNGPLAGRTLQQAADTCGAALLGSASTARYGKQVPLLAKLIDAARPLSLQVHPDDAWARTHEAESGHLGKAEAWFVLDARPGARIIRGFKRDVTAGEVRQAVKDGTLEGLMNVIPVRAGDVIFNPPGMVHAIGAGILLYEIQQSSDLTYRLYDYGRLDDSGRPRALHLEKALAVAGLQRSSSERDGRVLLERGRTELVRCDWFVLELLEVTGSSTLAVTPASLELLTCTAGSVQLEGSWGALPLAAGHSMVLPASLGTCRLAGSGTLMRSFLPAG
jgi:mannose-6-phosphate isomerase